MRIVRDGGNTAHKLGQKIRPQLEDPGLVMHTTLYLSPDEYDVFAGLPHHALRKTRSSIDLGGWTLSVDAFHDVLEGLVLAEVDLGGDDTRMPTFEPPPYSLAEVSRDERFTGGQLAVSDQATIDRALEAVSGLRLPR